MEIKKAIEAIKSNKPTSGYTVLCEALDIAVSALEKQIPKKLLEEKKIYGIGECPSCGAVFLDKNTKYCGNCGQALDCGDEE